MSIRNYDDEKPLIIVLNSLPWNTRAAVYMVGVEAEEMLELDQERGQAIAMTVLSLLDWVKKRVAPNQAIAQYFSGLQFCLMASSEKFDPFAERVMEVLGGLTLE